MALRRGAHWIGRLGTGPNPPIRAMNRQATGHPMVNERLRQMTPEKDCATAVAEFIRTKGVTRCPTACVLPTQGSVAAADREALERHAAQRDQHRRAKVAARTQQFWSVETADKTGN